MLGSLMHSIQFGAYERQVQKFLDEATINSILGGIKIAPRTSEFSGVGKIFHFYSVENNVEQVEQPYWNEESFKNFIVNTHPHIANCNQSIPTIQLLWRCLHFYAYHPFSRDPIGGRIGFAAFERAVSFLAFRCTDLLGFQKRRDYFWRNDDAFFRQSDFERVFRSISLPKCTKSEHESAASVSDIMDVLATLQPSTISIAPSQDQLEKATRKLLGETGFTQMQYLTSRNDLSLLLSLLLRLQLSKRKWLGTDLRFGTIERADQVEEDLAEIIVNGLREQVPLGENEEYLAPDQIRRAMDLLPNLHLQFYELWASLFQPPISGNDNQTLSKGLESIPRCISRTISLFVPHPIVHDHSQSTKQDMTITHLVKSLSCQPSPHVVLCTSNATATTPATIIGAYFPGPLWIKTKEGNNRKYKTGNSHFLFQLKPHFRILRWKYAETPLTDIINIYDDKAPSLEAISTSNGNDETSFKLDEISYRIGGPETENDTTGLRIDPETRSATLKGDGEMAWYKDVGAGMKRSWMVTVKLDNFDILTVTGGINTDLATGRLVSAEAQARYMREEKLPKVQGESLKKRIEGFGSN